MTAATPPEDRLLALEKLTLDNGAHPSFDAGHCAMEAVAWLAGEPHSDAPACACPVISRAMIRLNDRIIDTAMRTEILRPLLPKIIGSRSTREVMIKRGFVAADMAVRVFAPMALERRGRLDLATKLRELTEITDRATALAGRDAARAAAAAAATYTAAAADAAYAANAAAYTADAAAAAAYTADAAAAAAYTADAAAAASAARKPIYQLGVQMIEKMLAVQS